jgi:hypothetical protein
MAQIDPLTGRCDDPACNCHQWGAPCHGIPVPASQGNKIDTPAQPKDLSGPYSGPLWWESIKLAAAWLWKKATGQKVPTD